MKRTLLASALLMAFSGGALAAENPYKMPDDTWISLSGTAVETSPDSFVLDYGRGVITVEMDDWSWVDQEARGLIEGDKVTVYGEVDQNFLVNDTIEASAVYVAPLGTYFYANSADEESAPVLDVVTFSPDADVTVDGVVTEVSPLTDEFTIASGMQKISVETSGMAYDPLDETGFQRIEAGDRVSVSGSFEDDLLEGIELMAESIVTTRKGGG